MKYLFTVENADMLRRYEAFADDVRKDILAYIRHLQAHFAVTELPRAIEWTSEPIATQVLSELPIPAYTNDRRIVFTPDLDSWRSIYLQQLCSLDPADARVRSVRSYYEIMLDHRHLLQILGHELAHHSDWFVDDAYEQTVWFEEGMAEYISRQYFFPERVFEESYAVNRTLVELLREKRGLRPLEDFGAATYEGDYAGIFFAYWQSALAVKQIIDRLGGDVARAFDVYHHWCAGSRQTSLASAFGLESHP